MTKKKRAGIWQRRFSKPVNNDMLRFTASTEEDVCLIEYDIAASIAHVKMLRKQKIIPGRQARSLIRGLRQIRTEYLKGKFRLLPEHEDVHMNIEMRLQELIGSTGQYLHTARSRNDLVAADLRLYARAAIAKLIKKIIMIQKKLLESARKYKTVVMPGYTHLQNAQPVLWSFYVLSYVYRFQRDIECLQYALKRVNISPLGSCAFAGTTHAIDPDYTTRLLGFDRFADNGLDAVTDRDFLGEVSYICTQIMLHCSGFAEDMILYVTREFSLIELDESIATGSSIMPQKKNPDVFELIRVRAGNAIGNLTGLLSMFKGLPSAYNRDLQETKKVFFRQVENTFQCLDMSDMVIPYLRPQKNIWAEQENIICATGLADYLVQKGYAFRQAYDMIAQCVKESKGKVDKFIKKCVNMMKIKEEMIRSLIKPKNAVKAVKSKSGTGPKQTNQAMRRAERLVRKNQQFVRQIRTSSAAV
jgi:argininosuccinate lyase